MQNLFDIGQRLREARKLRGISQEDMADALGIHRRTVSRFERGETWTISLDVFNRWTGLLGFEFEVKSPPYPWEAQRRAAESVGARMNPVDDGQDEQAYREQMRAFQRYRREHGHASDAEMEQHLEAVTFRWEEGQSLLDFVGGDDEQDSEQKVAPSSSSKGSGESLNDGGDPLKDPWDNLDARLVAAEDAFEENIEREEEGQRLG